MYTMVTFQRFQQFYVLDVHPYLHLESIAYSTKLYIYNEFEIAQNLYLNIYLCIDDVIQKMAATVVKNLSERRKAITINLVLLCT